MVRIRVLVVDDHRIFAESLAAAATQVDEDAVDLDLDAAAFAGRGLLASAACGVCGRVAIADLELRAKEVTADTTIDHAVLATLRGVAGRLARGEHEVARRLSAELAAWFPAHVQHLDSALSHWLCKLRHGARPVVLHLGDDRRRAGPDRRDAVAA